MKVVAILQARMGSTRLPGKVMLPLAGKPMVQNIVERVQRAKRVDEVVLAPPECDREAFSDFKEVSYYAPGVAENDLVGRYLGVAIPSEADIIVRVPCDNPCVDPAYIDKAVKVYSDNACAFYSNTTDRWGGLFLDGIGCEVFSISRLKWLERRTAGFELWREHPHKYFEDHGYKLPTADLRLDVNTQADYDFIASIYNHFGHNRFTAADILDYPPVQERLHGR
jgi:spore coat polysaccharide biosynthesis protein SpsF (cytidylyltransferase family)